jgi:hypothetical protein
MTVSMHEPLPQRTVPPPAGDDDRQDPDSGRAGEVAGRARSEGRELAGTAADEARSVGHTAQEQAGHVVDEARGQARALLSSATSNLEQQAEEQTHRLADVLRSASEQSRALAEGRPEEAGDVDGYVRDLAGTLGDIAERIDRLGARGSMEELKQFARRRPAAFLAGATAAGFVASRFLRNVGDGAGGSGGDTAARDGAMHLPAVPPAVAPARQSEAPVAPPAVPPATEAGIADDLAVQPRTGPDDAPGTGVR